MSARRTVVRFGKQLGGQTSAALHGLLGSRAAGRVGILMYHRLSPAAPGKDPPTWNVTPDRFRSQLEGLLESGYNFWPLRRVIEHAEAGLTIPPGTAVVTFDDGYSNVYSQAFPVLRDLEIPATVFVASAYMDSTEPFPFDSWSGVHRHLDEVYWRPLAWDECREMEASGWVEIGSHTHSHSDLRRQPEAFRADLRRSLDCLRQELSDRVFTFAFPYGGRAQGFSDDSMLDVARHAGVRCALTTEIEVADPRTSPFGWGRLSAEQTDTPGTLSAKLEGWYDWMSRGREILRRVAPRRPVSRLTPPH